VPEAADFDTVGLGEAGAFEQSVLSIPPLEPAPVIASYFGDLD
jgi:hypothetical protein